MEVKNKPTYTYKVYDTYEDCFELLGRCKTMKEVNKLIKERIDDTDGECWCEVVKLDKLTGHYHLL